MMPACKDRNKVINHSRIRRAVGSIILRAIDLEIAEGLGRGQRAKEQEAGRGRGERESRARTQSLAFLARWARWASRHGDRQAGIGVTASTRHSLCQCDNVGVKKKVETPTELSSGALSRTE